jgi:hypothetical protein
MAPPKLSDKCCIGRPIQHALPDTASDPIQHPIQKSSESRRKPTVSADTAPDTKPQIVSLYRGVPFFRTVPDTA